jgi:hypothetical protein
MMGSATKIESGDHATTPSGRIVRIIKATPDGRFDCSYLDAPGDQVTLKPEHLVRLTGRVGD